MKKRLSSVRHYPYFYATVLILVVAICLALIGYTNFARMIIIAFSALMAVKLATAMVRDMFRGRYGVDILAVAAIAATIVTNEYWATIVIVFMMTGGEALEDYAAERAKRELTDLLERAPTTAHKKIGSTYTDVAIDEVADGDILRVLPGEVVPVDAIVLSGNSYLDESSLTGESIPVPVSKDDEVMSGAVNGESPIEIKALRSAENSQYAQIIALVKSAGEEKSPFVRLADRYAVPFTAVSFVIAGIAWWYSGDPVRFAQVLVVATPCPLLLAAPIAMISGMSRAAKHGIIIKSGGILEQASRVRSAAFDKTGTLTTNELIVARIESVDSDEDEVLRLSASVEQDSTHMTARAIVREAQSRNVDLVVCQDVDEIAGKGVRAQSGESVILVGRKTFLIAEGIDEHALPEANTTATLVAKDGRYVGAVYFTDTVREESRGVIERLRSMGVGSIAMVTGDSRGTAGLIAEQVGIDSVHAECLPKDKLDIITNMQPRPVMMTGDGLNDAPVLAGSDVGVAMGAKGATAASESADVVIMLDDISKVADLVQISKNTITIALQSIIVGIALSIVLMLVAATGVIPAVVGAGLQEVVDVIVILNALRAHRD